MSWDAIARWPDDQAELAQRFRLLVTLRPASDLCWPALLVRSHAAWQRLRATLVSHVGRTGSDDTQVRVRSDINEALSADMTWLRPWARAVQASVDGSGRFALVRHVRLPSLAANKAAELVSMAMAHGAIGGSNVAYEGVPTGGVELGVEALTAAIGRMSTI